MFQKIFSRVSATFDSEFTTWLPPCGELQHFIEELSGYEVSATEKDGELSLSGNLEAIVAIKVIHQFFFNEQGNICKILLYLCQDSLSNFIQETEQDVTSNDSETDIQGIGIYDFSNSNEEQTASTLENDVSSVDEEDGESSDWLNIEVLHSKARKENATKAFKFSCSMCSFKSQRESHYQRHINLHKSISTIFRCDECNFSTLRFTHLRRHQVIHSEKTLKCPTCNYSTDDSKLLARHQRLKHKVTNCANIYIFCLRYFHFLNHRLFLHVQKKLKKSEIVLPVPIRQRVYTCMNAI